MESAHESLNILLSIINFSLGFVGQDLNIGYLKKSRGFNPFVPLIVLLSSAYIGYMIRCMVDMENLTGISEIFWLIPLMIQYCVMLVNGHLRYQTALKFVYWANEIYSGKHSIDWVRNVIEGTNRKAMKICKWIFIISGSIFLSCGATYITDWKVTDKVLMTSIRDDYEDLSMTIYLAHLIIQVANSALLSFILIGYNLFLYLGGLVIIFRMKSISGILRCLKRERRIPSKVRRSVLIDCHEMHLEVSGWTNRFIAYHNFVALVQMISFSMTICFLLYMLQTPEARNFVSAAVVLAGIFQIFTACAFGEMIKTEVERIRDNLYDLDWHDYDLETRKLIHFLIVGTTPDSTVIIGFFFKLNVESFTTFIKLCFSFCAVLKAMDSSSF